jgi:hypothetical protein
MTRRLWQATELAVTNDASVSVAHRPDNPHSAISVRFDGLLAGAAPEGLRRRATVRVMLPVGNATDGDLLKAGSGAGR